LVPARCGLALEHKGRALVSDLFPALCCWPSSGTRELRFAFLVGVGSVVRAPPDSGGRLLDGSLSGSVRFALGLWALVVVTLMLPTTRAKLIDRLLQNA
jgi:hypothetical protein